MYAVRAARETNGSMRRRGVYALRATSWPRVKPLSLSGRGCCTVLFLRRSWRLGMFRGPPGEEITSSFAIRSRPGPHSRESKRPSGRGVPYFSVQRLNGTLSCCFGVQPAPPSAPAKDNIRCPSRRHASSALPAGRAAYSDDQGTLLFPEGRSIEEMIVPVDDTHRAQETLAVREDACRPA